MSELDEDSIAVVASSNLHFMSYKVAGCNVLCGVTGLAIMRLRV